MLRKESGIVLKVLPANSYLKLENDTFYLGENILNKERPAVEFLNINTRQELTEDSPIKIAYTGLQDDDVINYENIFWQYLSLRWNQLPLSIMKKISCQIRITL